ncbi:amidase family protein, partial [Staphylococcus sp. SIMBA_130]
MAKQIKAKEISPVEVVQSHLNRIKRLNPKLNLFITVFEEQAIAEAKAAEKELMNTGTRGPLHGVPIALKDLTSVAGRRTT